MILINCQEMDFIELFKRSFSRSERSGLAHFLIISSAVPPGSGAFQMPTCPSSSASAASAASASASTLRGGRANLRNASVTFSLFFA